jgi:small subunit ribosomal protein S21
VFAPKPLKRAMTRVFGGRVEKMSEVHIKDNESLDSALKRFKRNCQKSGVLSDLRKKEYYQSPSVKRRKKSEAARKNKNKRYN